jgi:hypothetical protein
MIKTAQLQAYWPKIYQKLQSPPQGTIRPFSKLPPFEKIKIDSTGPTGEPGAFGHVTTEDVDGDGNLDIVHISSPRLAQEFQKANIRSEDLGNIDSLPPEKLVPILKAFIEIISHELGHIGDYQHGEENPFPGGEAVADQAARSAIQQISIATTNIPNSFDKLGSLQMEDTILTELNSLAEHLDELGHFKLAERAEGIMSRFAGLPEKTAASRLFRPMGLATGPLPLTSKVDFDWGRYQGKHAGEPYWIEDGVSDLGSVQFPGDPFTYNEAGEGRIRVVSGPEPGKGMIGRLTEDPRFQKEAPVAKAPSAPGSAAKVDLLAGGDLQGLIGAASRKASYHESEYRSIVEKIAEQADSMVYSGAQEGQLRPWIDTLKNPGARPDEVESAIRSILRLSEDSASQADRRKLIELYKEAFEHHTAGVESRKQEKKLMDSDESTHDAGGRSIGPGGLGFSMEAKEDEENITKTAFELPEPPKQEELETLFWTGRAAGPFGRD